MGMTAGEAKAQPVAWVRDKVQGLVKEQALARARGLAKVADLGLAQVQEQA